MRERATLWRRVCAASCAVAATLAFASSAAAGTVQTWDTPSHFINPVDLKPTDLDNGKLTTHVILPDGYASRRCWPVLYLLHGSGAADAPASTEWMTKGGVDKMAIPAIVVQPGGGASWFIDNWWGGLRHPGWESWILREIVPLVAKRLHVCPQRSQHAIAGLSMGGYGAAYLGSQLPAYFGSIGSFSGAIAIERNEMQVGFTDYADIWGPPGGFWDVGHDPTALVRNLTHTRVLVEVGDGESLSGEPVDPGSRIEELEMVLQAKDFVTAARAAHVPVTFDQHGGAHSWTNWVESLKRFLAWNPFGPAAENPTHWTYSTVAQDSRAWGYHFVFSRPTTAVATFKLANGTLRGSGNGTVAFTTPRGVHARARLPFAYGHGRVRELKPSGRAGNPARKRNEVRVSFTPRKPRRTDPIQISFKTAQKLPADSEYEVGVLSTGSCGQISTTRIDQPAKGKLVSVVVRPQPSAGGTAAWCLGRSIVGVFVVKKATTGFGIGELVGSAPLNFP